MRVRLYLLEVIACIFNEKKKRWTLFFRKAQTIEKKKI